MRGLKLTAGLLTASLLAGCAAAPERFAEASGAAEPVPRVAAAAAEIEPAKVIDLSAVANDSASTVICREMLKEMSNVVITRCMTAADWEIYERAQTLWAQQFLRRLQGLR